MNAWRVAGLNGEIDAGQTVGETVYREIRTDIIFGRLVPGARLRLEALRKSYDISVTTLREILNRLNSEGFVVAEGQKGFRVAPISARDLHEIADLRILIEGHALQRAIENGDLDWEAAIVAAHHKLNVMEKRMLSGDVSVRAQWKHADWQFHRALIAGGDSEALMAVHASVFDKYLRYQMIGLTFRGAVAMEEHQDMKDAALARDAARCVAILKRHIEGGVAHSLAGAAGDGSVAAE